MASIEAGAMRENIFARSAACVCRGRANQRANARGMAGMRARMRPSAVWRVVIALSRARYQLMACRQLPLLGNPYAFWH